MQASTPSPASPPSPPPRGLHQLLDLVAQKLPEICVISSGCHVMGLDVIQGAGMALYEVLELEQLLEFLADA